MANPAAPKEETPTAGEQAGVQMKIGAHVTGQHDAIRALYDIHNQVDNKIGEVISVLRAAYYAEENYPKTDEGRWDISIFGAALALAREAERLLEPLDDGLWRMRNRVVTPEAGDPLPIEAIAEMLCLAFGGQLNGRGEEEAALDLATLLGGHAEHDKRLAPAFTACVEWLRRRGLNVGVERHDNLGLRVVSYFRPVRPGPAAKP